MTKEELERIKQAYNSGLKVQIWFNGYWEDFDARDYSMYPEPFSENRQYRIVGSAYADIAEKCIAELEKENALVKSLLYGTQRSCDNCGFVNCENFQRQRKSEPCSLYIPYQVRIKNLAHESDVLRESYNNSAMNLASVSEQLTKAKELLEDLVKFQPYINKEMIFHSIGNEWKTAIYKAKQFLNSEVEHD